MHSSRGVQEVQIHVPILEVSHSVTVLKGVKYILNIIKIYQILSETSRAAPVAWKEWQNADVNVASLGLVDA